MRRLAAGESSGGGVVLRGEAWEVVWEAGWGVVLGASGSMDAGCDNGEGLLVRFSSGLLLLAVESGVPSRACQHTLVSLVIFLIKRCPNMILPRRQTSVPS